MRLNSTYKKLEFKHDMSRYVRIKYLVACIVQVHENENFSITKTLSVAKESNRNKANLFFEWSTTSLPFEHRNRINEIRETNNNETHRMKHRFHLFDSIAKEKSLNLDLCEIPKHDFHLAPELEMVYQYIEKRPDLNKCYLLPTNKTINTFQISTTPITTNIWNGLALVDTFKDIEYNENQEDPLANWYEDNFKNFENLKSRGRIDVENIEIVEKLLKQYNPKNVPMTNVSFYEAILFCNKLSEYFGLEPYYNIESYKREQHALDRHYDDEIIKSKLFDMSASNDNITYFNVYKDYDHAMIIVESYFDKLWKVAYSAYDDGNISEDEKFERIDSKIKTKMRKDSDRYDDDDVYDYDEFKGFEDLKHLFTFPDIYDKSKKKIVYNSEFYTFYDYHYDEGLIGFKNILNIQLNEKNPINEKSNGFRLPFSWELLSIMSSKLHSLEDDLMESNKLSIKDSTLNLCQYERLTPKERLFSNLYSSNEPSQDIFCSSTKKAYFDVVYDIVGNVYKWVNDTFFIDKKHIEGDSECTDGQYEDFFGGTAIAFGCSYDDDDETLKRQGRDDKGNINITHDNLFRRLAIKQSYKDVGFFVCRNTRKD